MNFITEQLILLTLNLIMAYVFFEVINIKELNYIFCLFALAVNIIYISYFSLYD